MSKEMLNAFAMLEEQKGIKSEIVIEAIEQAYHSSLQASIWSSTKC